MIAHISDEWQDTLIWSEDANGTLTEETYLTSLHRYQELTRAQGIDHALQTYRLDALFFPKMKARILPLGQAIRC